MKNLEKIIWVIALMAIIVLIGVVGYGYYKKFLYGDDEWETNVKN